MKFLLLSSSVKMGIFLSHYLLLPSQVFLPLPKSLARLEIEFKARLGNEEEEDFLLSLPQNHTNLKRENENPPTTLNDGRGYRPVVKDV